MEQIQYTTSSSEYAQAMKSIRLAKSVFWLVVVLAIAVQIAATLLVHVIGIVCTLNVAQAASAPATDWKDWASWTLLLNWLLPASKFFAAVCALLLTGSMLLGVNIGLLGRRPGLSTMISTFFWSLILTAMLVPWQQIFNSPFASGALFNYADLKYASLHAAPNEMFFYARYLAYPALALLVAIIVQVKFVRASRAISGMPAILLAPEKPKQQANLES